MSSIVTVIKEVGTYRNNYVYKDEEYVSVHVLSVNVNDCNVSLL